MKNIRVIVWAGKKGLEAVIIIVGSLDECRRVEFKAALNRIPEKVNRIVVNLGRTTYIDAAGVSILVGLRAFSTLHNVELTLKNCNSAVRRSVFQNQLYHNAKIG